MIRKPDSTNTTRLQSAIDNIQHVLRDFVGDFTVEHLKAAEGWDDRFECLKWAVECRATVAEMRAWHRAQNGLDLFSDDEAVAKQTEPKIQSVKPVPCLCGAMPSVWPEDPTKEGGAWACVKCENPKCPANPRINDDESVADDRGSDAYKAVAIERWNHWISGEWSRFKSLTSSAVD